MCYNDPIVIRIVLGAAAALIVIYLGLILLVYLRQESMVYMPSREVRLTPRLIGLEYAEVRLRTKDGVALSAWYVPAKSEQGVLLFCHGNAGNISHRLDSIRIFNDLNLSVLIFDYRGYGESEGRPSEEGTYLDAEAAWDYLVHERKAPPERIVLFGRSLGGAVAAELATRRRAAALIVESSFTSVAGMAHELYPWLPVRRITRFRYATIDKIGKIACPKLIVHSPHDEVIPFSHGLALFEKAAPPKRMLRIAGSHNEGFLLSGQTYGEGLKQFIADDALGPAA